ncbi:MAG: PAS domain S-box protein [Rhodocyclaceae bacterium]|nr:PAS domain S-box protein [Rhodocyclaceae bacterium]
MRMHIRPLSAVVVLTALTIFSIVVSVTFLLWDLRKRELEHGRLEAVSLTRMLMEQTEQAFDGADLVLRGVQERLQTAYGSQFPLDSPPVHLLLAARISGMQQLRSLYLVDAEGHVVNSSRDSIAQTAVGDRDSFKAFADGKLDGLFVGNPMRGPVDGDWTLHIARRLNSSDGKFRGIVVAALNLEHFEQLYAQMKLDFSRPISLYLAKGSLVASLPHRENELGLHPPELEAEILSLDEGDVRVQSGFAFGRVSRFPLLVGVNVDEADTLASWRETALPIALGAILVSIFIAFVAALLAGMLRREETLSRALREADDRYQRTIDSVMDAIVAIDEAQLIVMFNPAAERMFGFSMHEAIGSPLVRLIPERLREGHPESVDKFMHSDISSRSMAPHIEITGLRADGREFPIESTISHTLVGGRRQLTAVLRDVTERHRAEAELRAMNQQLRGLSSSLQNVREQERTRIARELHDELGQQLTGLKLDLSWLSSRLKEGREATPEKVDSMRRLLDATIASVRRISSELRPLILDDLGFGEAISWQVGEFNKRTGIGIVLDLPATEYVKDDVLATALFRIVQESLTNIARHANAAHVEINLYIDMGNIVLKVFDNGRGFAPGRGQGAGFGLVSMRERATALGGRFVVVSSPGAGTSIEVVVPLDQSLSAESEA